MLAKAKGESIASSGRQLPSPQGHFLLLPSENNSLLLKSIAVSELMLPNDIQTHAEEPSESALSVVESCLDQVSTINTENLNGLLCSFLPIPTVIITFGPKIATMQVISVGTHDIFQTNFPLLLYNVEF